jgi:RimJ/RimL family protein N-acetyltransferase
MKSARRESGATRSRQLLPCPLQEPLVIHPKPITLERDGIRLEPLNSDHHDGLLAAAADGDLWNLWFTAVPAPDATRRYIEDALEGQQQGHMLPWAVRELASGQIVGSSRYHDIVADIDRVEIGYTWYAKSRQRTAVNTVCKLLLLTHAFEQLGCKVVGLRTDNFNFASQRAIETLGAKKDGVIRHHQARRDGTVRDSVMYSILAGEWPDVRRHLELRLARNASHSPTRRAW